LTRRYLNCLYSKRKIGAKEEGGVAGSVLQSTHLQSTQGGFATENAEKKCPTALCLGAWDSVSQLLCYIRDSRQIGCNSAYSPCTNILPKPVPHLS
jgi:hypothetical protein